MVILDLYLIDYIMYTYAYTVLKKYFVKTAELTFSYQRYK